METLSLSRSMTSLLLISRKERFRIWNVRIQTLSDVGRWTNRNRRIFFRWIIRIRTAAAFNHQSLEARLPTSLLNEIETPKQLTHGSVKHSSKIIMKCWMFVICFGFIHICFLLFGAAINLPLHVTRKTLQYSGRIPYGTWQLALSLDSHSNKFLFF